MISRLQFSSHSSVWLLLVLFAALLPDIFMSQLHSQGKVVGTPEPKELCGYLDSDEIKESSGLARSLSHLNILWTHNDSGDEPRIFAVDDRGHVRAEVAIQGVHPIDWEDITSFRLGGTSYLAIADTGNNQLSRKVGRICILREPSLNSQTAKVIAEVSFAFDDSPHDCESIAYDPVGKQFLLAAKTLKFRTGVYSVSWPVRENSRPQNPPATAKCLGHIPVPFVTSMDLSPDSKHLVFLSFFHAAEYTLPDSAGWKQAFLTTPSMTVLPARSQGEAICYSSDGSDFFLTSERLPTPLLKVPVKSASP